MTKKHIVIVGAGPGGLTSAMILAHRGFKVTVFEKEAEVGGRNAPIRLNGFTFDTGPTLLAMNYILKEMFEEAGRKVEDYLDFVNLDPLYRLQFNDCAFSPSQDREKTKSQIRELFPGNENGLDAFFRIEGKRFEKLFPGLQKDYSSFFAYFNPIFLTSLPYLSLGKSLFENLGTYFNQDKLKTCFTFQSKYLGMSPWKCPALFTMLVYTEYAYGIYHVIGGLNKISQAMAKVVEEEGGRIIKGAKVKRIITKGRVAQGVQLESGEKVLCDDVFINADFAYAATHLFEPGLLKKYSEANLQKKQYSCSTFMLYLGVNKRFDFLQHQNVLFPADYRKHVDEIIEKKVLSQDPSIYVQNASVSDPTLAPPGKSALYILVPVPNNKSRINWTDTKDEYKAKVLNIVEEKGGFEGLQKHIEVEKVITPEDWEHEYNVYLGATFNLAHTFGQLLYFRPHNKFEELEHCYLVGGGTHPGSGLPTIYESARISSNLLSQSYGVDFAWPSALRKKQLIKPKT